MAAGPFAPAFVGLQALDFDCEAATLSLRHSECRSLPFTLRRQRSPDQSAVAQVDTANDGALLPQDMEKPDA